MEMLDVLSAYLDDFGPEGKIPPSDELEALRQSVADLLEEIDAADLPPEIRRTLLHRLRDMLAALDHLKIGGPDAVRRAAESLATTAMLCEDAVNDKAGVLSRIKSVAKNAWVAFTVASALANGALTWDRITGVQALPPTQEQRQLPPGSSDSAGSDDELRPHA